MQDVDLDVEHGQPDPHGRDDLHQRQAPIRDQELEALEEHEEGADDQSEGGEPAAAPAQIEHGPLHRGVVATPDGIDQAEDGGADPFAALGAADGGGRRTHIVVVHRHPGPLVGPVAIVTPPTRSRKVGAVRFTCDGGTRGRAMGGRGEEVPARA